MFLMFYNISKAHQNRWEAVSIDFFISVYISMYVVYLKTKRFIHRNGLIDNILIQVEIKNNKMYLTDEIGLSLVLSTSNNTQTEDDNLFFSRP